MGNKRNSVAGAKLLEMSPPPARCGGTAGRGNSPLQAVNDDPSTPGPVEFKVAKRESISILVADDHPVVLAGLMALLSGRPDMRITDQARDGQEAVDKFLALRPDVGLFELHMPVMGGIEAITAIRAKEPTAGLLIFTNCQTEEGIYRAIRAGAQGYLFKNAPAEELVESIRAVAEGGKWIPPLVAAKLARRVADRELTVREKDVLRAITGGKSNKEIGTALNISEATVKVHVTHILDKLSAGGRTDAIRLAVQRGLVYMDSPIAA